MHFNVYCGTIYNGQDTEASLMSINRGTYKEDAAHLYNRILHSYKKKKDEICRDVDGPGDCHTE